MLNLIIKHTWNKSFLGWSDRTCCCYKSRSLWVRVGTHLESIHSQSFCLSRNIGWVIPKNYLFSLSIMKYLWIKVSKKKFFLFNFEKKSTVHSSGQRRRFEPEDALSGWGTSAPFLAEISVWSPQKVFIFATFKKSFLDQSIQNNLSFFFPKPEALWWSKTPWPCKTATTGVSR